MKEFRLQIVTPDGTEFDGTAQSLLVKGSEGDIEILAGHTDLFSSLGTGRVRIKRATETMIGSSSGGFLSVSKDGVKLIATTFEFKDEINLERARAAKEIAEQKLREAKSERDMNLAKAKLARALTRISVKGMK